MLKQTLQQKMLQKLSPMQIQTIKLLELPTLQLEQRVKKELEENPILEEGNDKDDEVDNEYEDDTPNYRLYSSNTSSAKEMKQEYATISSKETFYQQMEAQLGFRKLNHRQNALARFLIGSLDEDGYLRRDMNAIVDDVAFRLNIETSKKELEELLSIIQGFEPSGVGARNLQECLLIQLQNKKNPTPATKCAISVLRDCFEAFAKKHYDKILSKLDITEEQLKNAIDEIVRLNPRPGGSAGDSAYQEQAQQVIPDFLLEVGDNGEFQLSLPRYSIPELRLNSRYAAMLEKAGNPNSADGRAAAAFVKQKMDAAKWFIEAIKQRQQTLTTTMNAILDYQREYFEEGDESLLRPMVLKTIAERTGLDVSTVSRVVNGKYIQTHFGIYPLKHFFTEGLKTESGEEVSTREIKNIMTECIDAEDKKNPYTDEELVEVLHQKGFKVVRRTVAKYRDQLNIPVARLRKEL